MISLLHDSRVPKMTEVFKQFNGPINMLEIGTWYGSGSFRLWLEHIHPGSTITLIDMWKTISNDGLPSLQTNSDDIAFEAWLSTMNEVRKFEKEKTKDVTINVIRADSNPFLETLNDKLFDFIYVDGDHGYSGCYYDVIQAKRLIKSNGIICGDDLDISAVDKNINDLRSKALGDRFAPYHPGVSVALYDAFGSVNNHAGFWWINVKDGNFVV